MLSDLFTSEVAIGIYVVITIILIPVSIYFYKSGSLWWERALGAFMVGGYVVLTIVLAGAAAQTYVGHGANVMIALVILYILLMYLMCSMIMGTRLDKNEEKMKCEYPISKKTSTN